MSDTRWREPCRLKSIRGDLENSFSPKRSMRSKWSSIERRWSYRIAREKRAKAKHLRRLRGSGGRLQLLKQRKRRRIESF